MVTNIGRIITYLDGLQSIKSLDPLIATKLGKAVIYHEEFLLIKLLDP